MVCPEASKFCPQTTNIQIADNVNKRVDEYPNAEVYKIRQRTHAGWLQFAGHLWSDFDVDDEGNEFNSHFQYALRQDIANLLRKSGVLAVATGPTTIRLLDTVLTTSMTKSSGCDAALSTDIKTLQCSLLVEVGFILPSYSSYVLEDIFSGALREGGVGWMPQAVSVYRQAVIDSSRSSSALAPDLRMVGMDIESSHDFCQIPNPLGGNNVNQNFCWPVYFTIIPTLFFGYLIMVLFGYYRYKNDSQKRPEDAKPTARFKVGRFPRKDDEDGHDPTARHRTELRPAVLPSHRSQASAFYN